MLNIFAFFVFSTNRSVFALMYFFFYIILCMYIYSFQLGFFHYYIYMYIFTFSCMKYSVVYFFFFLMYKFTFSCMLYMYSMDLFCVLCTLLHFLYTVCNKSVIAKCIFIFFRFFCTLFVYSIVPH